MQREVTLTQVMCWMLALVGGVGALSLASLLFLADSEPRAAAFGVGGLALLLWSVFHLTDRGSG